MKLVRNKLITFLFLILSLSVYLLSVRSEIEVTPNVMAATDSETAEITVSCSFGTTTMYMPTAFTIPLVTHGDPPVYPPIDNIDIVSGAVESDDGPRADMTQNSAGVGDGYLLIDFDIPKFKIAGLNCTTFTSANNQVADNDLFDNAEIDIDIEGSGTTDFSDGNKFDTSTTFVTLHGSGGRVKTSNCVDDGGTNERSGAAINGEVQGGGEGTSDANCGGHFLLKFDNIDSSGNQSETIRWKVIAS